MLTDTKLRNLKPRDKLYKANDRDGLYAAVTSAGTISFRYNYSISGRQETLTTDHQSGLHRHEGRQRVHRQDHGHQSAVADGFYLPEDHWLGLDGSIHDTG